MFKSVINSIRNRIAQAIANDTAEGLKGECYNIHNDIASNGHRVYTNINLIDVELPIQGNSTKFEEVVVSSYKNKRTLADVLTELNNYMSASDIWDFSKKFFSTAKRIRISNDNSGMIEMFLTDGSLVRFTRHANGDVNIEFATPMIIEDEVIEFPSKNEMGKRVRLFVDSCWGKKYIRNNKIDSFMNINPCDNVVIAH